MSPNPLSGGDPRNRLFNEGRALYRAYTAEAADEVTELFNRGIIRDLVGLGYIPETRLSDRRIPGYAVVLQHERIDRISYAHEWTFGMLRDAALFVLTLREYLAGRGYDLIDGHCDNVTFHRGRPVWLDLGSFVKSTAPGVWIAERRFLQSFVYPLQVWGRLGEFIGRRSLVGSDYLPREAALLATRWSARRLPPAALRKLCTFLDNYSAMAGAQPDQLRPRLERNGLWRKLAAVVPSLTDRLIASATQGRLPWQIHRGDRLARLVAGIEKRGYQTRWEDYHSGVLREVSEFRKYPRFRRVLEHLVAISPKSITEIGTNQGALATLILEEVKPAEMVCLDIDDGALERFYARNRTSGETRVSHAVLDVIRPFTTLPKSPASERYRSEALVALAVSHHMVLGQCNSMEYFFERLVSFTSGWVLVEYMPHGFHTVPVATPPPDTYSVARFDGEFRKHFEVVSIEQLEPTRTLYVGRLRTGAPASPA